MRRSAILAISSILALTGCKGSKGSAGAAGPQGPSGPVGPAGPLTTPPHITSVLPGAGGSAKNFWVINGENFSTSDAANIVRFNGDLATVVSATATKLVVTDAFGSVGEAFKSVTVEVANQISNSVTTLAFESGTTSTLGFGSFRQSDEVAISATKTYVREGSTGIWSFDRATKIVKLEARAQVHGLGDIRHIAVGPSNTLYLIDRVAGSGISGPTDRVLRQLANGSFALTAQAPGGAIEGMAWDAGNDLFLLQTNGGTTSVTKSLPNGLPDAAFTNNVISNNVASLVVQGANAFAIDITNQRIVQVDGATGAVTDFVAPAVLTGMVAMAGDGTNLYVLESGSANRLSVVDNAAAITPFGLTSVTGLGSPKNFSSFASIASTNAGVLYLTGGTTINRVLLGGQLPESRVVRLDDNTEARLEVAGSVNLIALEHLADGTMYGAELQGCVTRAAGNEGTLYSYDLDGTTRFHAAPRCLLGTMTDDGTSLVFANLSSGDIVRINPATGVEALLADATDGIGQTLGLARDSAGNFYAVGLDSTQNFAGVQKISGNGTVTNDFVADATASLYFAGTVVGNDLWLMESGASGLVISKVPLATGGTPTPVTTNLTAVGELDALESDGGTGAFLSDLEAGQIYHIAADGTVTPVGTLGGLTTVAIDVDAYGDVLFQAIENAGDITIVMP